VLELLGDLLSASPLWLIVLVAAALIGFMIGDGTGAIAGGVIGFIFGLWLDLSKNVMVERLRLPVGVVVLLLALFLAARLIFR
jgi:hypothetical protein